MQLTVQLFAALKDPAHANQLAVELPEETATVGTVAAPPAGGGYGLRAQRRRAG